MCLLYTQTQRCPSCKKTVWQSTVMFDSCDKPSCTCVSCSSTIKGVRTSRYASADDVPLRSATEGNVHTAACPKAELVHGWPQWASQPCGFCRWQRSLEVRRQWYGVHFCINPSSTGKATTRSPSSPATPKATKQGETDASPKTPPEVVSDLSEAGWSQPCDSVSSSSPQGSARRKKSVRFQEPLTVEKKRSSILARFRLKTA